MASLSAYNKLKQVPLGELGAWLRRNYPAGKPHQWWLGVYGSAENALIAPSHRGDVPDVDDLRYAVAVLEAGVADSFSACSGAYWLIRFAATTMRYPGLPDLPDALTPDGAARRALAAIPLTRDAYVALARRRVDLPAGPETRTLHEVSWLIPSFEWIQGELTDEDLKREVAAWLTTDTLT